MRKTRFLWLLSLVAVIAMTAMTVSPALAQVSTDQADYCPGSVVTISGSVDDGFTQGEDVFVKVYGPNTFYAEPSVAWNENGEWIAQFTLWADERAVGSYNYTAKGMSSETAYEGTFTDVAPPKINFATTGLTAGTTVSVSYDGTNNGGNPIHGPSVFNAPGPSADIACLAWSSFTFTFPTIAGYTFAVDTTSPFTNGPNGSSKLITATYTPVSINHAPAIATDNSSVTVDEGLTATNTGTWSDADAGDTVSLTASVGTVNKSGTNAAGTWSWSYATTDGPDQSQQVKITANDGHTTTNVTFDLTVNNVAPSVGPITVAPDPAVIAVGSSVTASASFTDPGTDDTHTASWDWADTTSSPGTVVEADGAGTASGSHTYTAAGIYTVTCNVTDDDGGSGASTFMYVVVYDPSAGFVTGGGWIDSPAGAYVADPDLTGKATFGFVSKYVKGKALPTGNTEFQFHAAGLNFSSTAYDWLVVAGSQAIYKGIGTINGGGSYMFILSAFDGGNKGVDKFRIKICDGADVVYDNQMGGGDDASPTTAIAGGSIIVHK